MRLDRISEETHRILTRKMTRAAETTRATPSMQVLNRIAKDKIAQVLVHVLDRLGAKSETVFSVEEAEQLQSMLGISKYDVRDLTVAASTIFREAAVFGSISREALAAQGLSVGVINSLEKTWRKKGKAHADGIATTFPLQPSHTLTNTEWTLQVELGQRYLSKQTSPAAVFQLDLTSNNGPTEPKKEKIALEMNHTELYAFFRQLNAIQIELDGVPA